MQTSTRSEYKKEPGSVFTRCSPNTIYSYWECRHCGKVVVMGYNSCENCRFDIRYGFTDNRGNIKDMSYQHSETSKRDCSDYKKTFGSSPP